MLRRIVFRFSKEKINTILDHEEHLTNKLDSMSQAYTGSKMFNNYTVFKNRMQVDGFHAKLRRSVIAYLTVWGCVGGVTFLYVHPWATVIPAFFAIQTVSSYMTGNRYLGKLVKQITLEKDQKHCLIELANQKTLKVKISDNDLLNISDVIQKSSNKIEEEVNEKYRQTNFVIQFETVYENKIYEDLRVLVTKDSAEIPNIKLLQDMVTGEDVSGYVYHEIVQQEQTKETDEEIEKRLKDELKI